MTDSVSTGEILNDRYVIEHALGEGGMAKVFSARHTVLGHRVAVKVMSAAMLDDPELRERFLREARTAAQLQSAHVSRVNDYGVTSRGAPFIVMEYLEGEDLATFLRRKGPLDPVLVVELALQICEALGEAHGLGLVHRDIAPKNLFVTRMVDDRPFVKVLDFGLVKTRRSNQELTRRGEVFGSPHYLSPEQTRSARDVDARTDIWALGVCLYELLSGRLPFTGRGVAGIYRSIQQDAPPPLPAPPALAAVVLRCLEKDRERRFRSVAELAIALESCLGRKHPSTRVAEIVSLVQRRDAMPTLAGARERRFTATSWDSSGERREKSGPGWLTVIAAAAFIAALGVLQTSFVRSSEDPAPATASEPPPPVAEPAAPPTPIAVVPPASASAAPSTKPAKMKVPKPRLIAPHR